MTTKLPHGRPISTTIALALAVIANPGHAVGLNPDGVGQVLIYPYYTVNGGNSTLLSVVNTDRLGKLVSLRFVEAYNGQDTLDFQVLLAPYDIWTSNVFALDSSGPANLLTDDESCTVPDIKDATGSGLPQLPDGRRYVAFRNVQYQTDGGPKTVDRTREGHVLMFEQASVKPNSSLETAISHVNGVPPGCASVSAMVIASSPDLLPPSGGLYGSASIVNPALGTVIGYNADALDSFYLLSGNLVPGPGQLPSLADARTGPVGAVAHTYTATGAVGPNRLISSSYTASNAIDAVSAVFAASVLTNEYIIEAVSASESEWVVTFPTKNYYVNSSPAIAPFLRRFAAPGESCVLVSYHYGSRDGGQVNNPEECMICPPPPSAPTQMCLETQVLTFQKAEDYAAAAGVSAVLGSRRTVNVDPRNVGGFSSGWLRLDLSPDSSGATELHALRPSIEGNVFHGLPVTGFLATNYLNRNNGAPGVLANYSLGARHRVVRECTNEQPGGTGFCS